MIVLNYRYIAYGPRFWGDRRFLWTARVCLYDLQASGQPVVDLDTSAPGAEFFWVALACDLALAIIRFHAHAAFAMVTAAACIADAWLAKTVDWMATLICVADQISCAITVRAAFTCFWQRCAGTFNLPSVDVGIAVFAIRA